MGWKWQSPVRRVNALPLLHETMVHPTLPSVELHWRVHWYEGEFAGDALARAERPAPGEPLRMQPMDGLVALMLFYARDGFSGLRFPADVASWWDLRCAGASTSSSVAFVAQRYPALTGPVMVASRLLADLVGLPGEGSRPARFRWRAAEGLASPFVDSGHLQAEANAGLADVLLAPPRGAGDAIRRVLDNAPVSRLGPPTPTRALSVPAGHAVRVTRRWALAFPRAVLRGYVPGPPTIWPAP
jgi:hypothetical protein